jgi:hypothetical protein
MQRTIKAKLSGLGAGLAIIASLLAGGAAYATSDIDYSNVTQPVLKDQCKNGGWVYYIDDQGQPFKNQGQCVAYTNHHTDPIYWPE